MEAVAAAVDRPSRETLLILEGLVRGNLLEREASSEGALFFRVTHPSLAELLLDRMSPRRRRALRSRAARHLRDRLDRGEEAVRETLARLCEETRRTEEAARHYEELGRSARLHLEPERAYRFFEHAAGLRETARLPLGQELLEAKADLAMALGRYREVLSAGRRLLRRAGGQAGLRAEHLIRMGRAEMMLGENESARRHLEAALRSKWPGASGRPGIEARWYLANVARNAGDYDDAARLYAEAISRAEAMRAVPKELLIQVLTSQGEFHLKQGDVDRAEACFRRCLDLSRSGRERSRLPAIHLGLGQLLLDRRPAEAAVCLDKAASLARKGAQVNVEAAAHYNLGIAYTDLARLDQARDHYLIARDLFRRSRGVSEARAEAQLGNLARERGDFRQAEEHYRRFQERARALPAGSPVQLLHRINRALLDLARGEAQGALEDLRGHEEEFRPEFPRSFMAYQRARARLELAAGDPEEARLRALRTTELAAAHRDQYFRAAALMILGEVEAAGPEPASGRARFVEARTLAREMGNLKLEAEADLLLAELAGSMGEDPRPHLVRGREVFTQAGMRPALERAGKVEALWRRSSESSEAAGRRAPAKELGTLYRASEAIRSCENLDDLLEKLLDAALELMGAERGFIFLKRPGPRRLELGASRGGDRETLRDAGQISRNILRSALRDARPIFSTNAMLDDRFRKNQSVLNYGIRSFICAPLLLPDRALGTLYVDHRKLDHLFVESDAEFLMAFAGFAASAIENALLHGRLHDQVRHLRREVREHWGIDQIVGVSPQMRRVMDLVRRVGPLATNVLIRGESGTGKELVARALHEHSPRADRPFVAVNCAALPTSLVESELFGVVRGAATDVEDRAGKFEEANGGTLFLDEISDLALPAQAKILRAIQDRRIERLGSNRPVDLEIRLVAATHTDLEAAIEEATFREDLYYRLNVVELTLAPLRERREDIPALIRHYVDRFCMEQNKPSLSLEPGSLASYLEYDWPGNVRELKNAIERAVLFADGSELPPFEPPTARERGPTDLVEAFDRGYGEREIKEAYARLVYRRLEKNKRQACKRLGIDYKTLQSRLSSDS